MKFAIGERVRIRDDIQEGGIIVNGMLRYAGIEDKVIRLSRPNDYVLGNGFCWPESALESLDKPKCTIQPKTEEEFMMMLQ